ncbi:hypothetical protein KKH05_01510, partial [Patescibacteria group bacterium]|nr:hypothetical protein [Patescibacteria group bacterium]
GETAKTTTKDHITFNIAFRLYQNIYSSSPKNKKPTKVGMKYWGLFILEPPLTSFRNCVH